jgi:sigma-B regulation protein RsbU (phosphoserine phosphatase)
MAGDVRFDLIYIPVFVWYDVIINKNGFLIVSGVAPMKHHHRFGLSNAMMIGNIIANMIGILIGDILNHQAMVQLSDEIMAVAMRIDAVFIPVVFLFLGVVTLAYEWPIRKYLKRHFRGQPISDELCLSARRRLLNEPFLLISLDLILWLAGCIIYSIGFYHVGIENTLLQRGVIQMSLIGLITTIIAFFILEHLLQKRLSPHIFPEGGLASVPRTLRIRIRTRLTALFIACNLIPFLAVLLLISDAHHLEMEAEALLNLLHSSLIIYVLVFVMVGLLVTMLVSLNLTRPMIEISSVLKKIRNGRLDKRVRVTTNDEIGYTGDVINEMTEGLRERARMRRSLDLAREIQQRLLPVKAPSFKGLDVAGRSIYCDQTGGDYFDFFDLSHMEPGSLGLVVGDVAGHGIPSALLMATARAFLRLRSFMPGSLAQVISDVNHQLSMDLGESGQFMTLYYMVLNPDKQSLRWVRAGHDAAILYDPEKDQFEELYGSGLALGVDPDFDYTEASKNGLHAGQLVLIGTDGIWEARNQQGRMFGKKALYDVIRDNHQSSANEIIDAVIENLRGHQMGREPEDDVTLVVLKL